MNATATQKSGLWKPWKNKLRFPTLPTAPTAAHKSRQEAADPKTTDDCLHKTFDATKSDGVKIKYEIGFSQGMAVDADQKATYVWYREQKMNGRVTRYALSKINILAISIPLDDDPNTLHVANFYGTIRKPEDIIDMLLMISPFAFK